MNYNPYDLVQLLINGKPIDGRPIEFDSEVVNQKTMANAFGALVKPSKVMTMCPDCGQGLEVNLRLGDPPFDPVVYSCIYCKPAPPPLSDPFLNPVQTGRIPAFELDPILHDPKQPLADHGGTAADRFKLPDVALPGAAVVVPVLQPAQKPPRPKKPKRGKKKEQVVSKPMVQQEVRPRPEGNPGDPFTLTKTAPSRPVEVEKVEGLDEEEDFDDSGMVEDT